MFDRGVRNTFLALFLPAAVLFLGVVGYGYDTTRRSQQAIVEAGEAGTVALQAETIKSALDDIVSDLRILAALAETHDYLRHRDVATLGDLEVKLLNFARHKPRYAQLRILDWDGWEVVRVDKRDGRSTVVPPDQLQLKANRYYFTETFQLEPGQVYVSPLDLNVEQEVIEQPHRPMMRFGMPVFGPDGYKRGIMVLNYLARFLIADLQRVAQGLLGEFLLLDSAGYWLVGPDPAQEWGFMDPERQAHTFANAFPESWRQIGATENGQFYSPQGLFTFTTVFPRALSQPPGLADMVTVAAADRYAWHIVSHVAPEVLRARTHPAPFMILAIVVGGLGLLAAATGLIVRASERRRRAIAALQRNEQRIEHLAYYDALTELPNRTLLAQRAEWVLASAARHHTGLAVLFLDLDNFKEVNDSLGHAEGDALLVQVAARLQEQMRAVDTVSRLGGDEFVLLLPDTDQNGARCVADKLLVAFRQPFPVAGHGLRATLSIGIALYPDDGVNFTELLKNADTALYRAKQNGRNSWAFYARDMNVATFERLVMESELRQAIAAGQLRTYYQPKVRLADGELVGAEALVRWQHPDHGLIPPGRFIPVAEASDLIVELGNWVLADVCRQLAVWRAAGRPPMTVAVNLAARQFRDPEVIDRIEALLAAHDLPPQTLELELTESSLLEVGAPTTHMLLALQRLGVGLAIDDFGTGYSNLGYLKRLPLTALKIDQSFVRDLETDPDDQTLTATIVALGHGLGLRVVAEGVETSEQRRILLEQGCDFAQGYYFGRPVPAEAFQYEPDPLDGLDALEMSSEK